MSTPKSKELTGTEKWKEYKQLEQDLKEKLKIYEGSAQRPRSGRAYQSPDNPIDYRNQDEIRAWEKEHGGTEGYRERQAKAVEDYNKSIDELHTNFKDDFGIEWGGSEIKQGMSWDAFGDAKERWDLEDDWMNTVNRYDEENYYDQIYSKHQKQKQLDARTLDDYKAADIMGYKTRTYDASKAWNDYTDLNPNIHDLATRIAPDLRSPHGKPVTGLHMADYGGLEGRDFEANPEWGIDIKRQDYGDVLQHWRESVDASGSGRSDILDWGGGGDAHQAAFNKALIEGDVDYDWYNQNQQYTDLATKASELAAKPGLFGQDWSEFENIQQIRYLNELIGEGAEPTATDWSWDYINKFEQMIDAQEEAEYLESIQPKEIDVSGTPETVPGVGQGGQFSDLYASPEWQEYQDRMSQLETQYSTQQSLWDSERATLNDLLAAQQAGWADKTAAWDQKEADWTSQFAQQQLGYETNLAAALEKQKGQHLSDMAIQGEQFQSQIDEWQTQAAAERDRFAEQLEAAGIQSEEEKEQLKAAFAQQQQASALAAKEERAQLESQLKTQYSEQWDKQQQELTSKYENLLNQATTDAEFERISQAQEFEQKQLDQQAAWNEQSQEWADKDRVYQSQLEGLKSDLGLQQGLYAGLQDQYDLFKDTSTIANTALQSQLSGLQTSSAAERAALEKQILGLETSSATERDSFMAQLESLQTSSEAERQLLQSGFDTKLASERLALEDKLREQERLSGEEITGLTTALSELEGRHTTQKQAWEQQLADLGESNLAERQVLESQLANLETSSAAERTELESQLTGLRESSALERESLQTELGGLEQEFGKAKTAWSEQAAGYEKQIGDVSGQVSGLQTRLTEEQKKRKELDAAVKRNEEMAIKNAERARVSASYGTQGTPLNKQVQGVRTLNELTPTNKMYGGTTGSFNRKGLRIKNLNI